MDELKQKFRAVQQNEKIPYLTHMMAKNISTQASWSNREEEWYVTNKVLLFATQSEDASNIWVTKLNDLLHNFETPRKHDVFFPDVVESQTNDYDQIESEKIFYEGNRLPSAVGLTPQEL